MPKLTAQILMADPVLEEMVRRLVGSLQPEKIYLSRSYLETARQVFDLIFSRLPQETHPKQVA